MLASFLLISCEALQSADVCLRHGLVIDRTIRRDDAVRNKSRGKAPSRSVLSVDNHG